MKTILTLTEIKNLFDIDPSLSLQTDEDKFILLYGTKKINELTVTTGKEWLFEFRFLTDIKLITPSVLLKNGRYHLDYSLLPLTTETVIDYRYVILRLGKIYCIIAAEIDQSLTIEYQEDKTGHLIYHFPAQQTFKLSLAVYETLTDFYRKVVRPDFTVPIWGYGIGIMHDLLKAAGNSINYAMIKKELLTDALYIMIHHWDSVHASLTEPKNGLTQLDDQLQKLNLNHLYFCLTYSNYLAAQKVRSEPVLRMRNGNLSQNANRAYLDYYNADGETLLIEIYTKLFTVKTSGIYLDTVWPLIPDTETLEKTICKNEREYQSYNKQVLNGIKKLNHLIGHLKENQTDNEKIFFGNLLSAHLLNSVFLITIVEDFKQIARLIEEFFLQGFFNTAIHFESDQLLLLTRQNIRKLMVLFFPVAVIFDIQLIIEVMKRHDAFKDSLYRILMKRISFRIIYDNLIDDFKKNGILPFQLFYEQNEPAGFFLGSSLYCSIIKERVFDAYFTLPEGNWYHIDHQLAVSGPGNFIQHQDKESYQFFQKEGSVLQYLIPTHLTDSLHPSKIKFVIYPKPGLTTEINERFQTDHHTEMLQHKFIITHENDRITLLYRCNSQSNYGRNLIFHLVLPESKNKSILCNNKPLYMKNNGTAFLEFNLLIKESEYHFEII